jgi:TorA maturation chaperone TorD
LAKEAVYRDERELDGTRVRGQLLGPSALAVKELYREAGLQLSGDSKDLPDHVGLELACMASRIGSGDSAEVLSPAWWEDRPALSPR